ncbi:phosphate propanoyltransferase [Heliophilum fasciatum]|uniref:Phosphate propanoyltransferase n=1 Tax=Heliophilum fasciatum TaxID=35700 RepID=A0A4R2RCB0_9FIRM|nr:phosphate propanoyltransferase [Heliophilum fasciatum]MCW2279153.1 putative phosphotransacetylase [Heliophilum fasciatum]TCP61012.1 putative phosphotransacetylase [Heliophilum fasciatum]
MQITIGVSARHIHLTAEHLEILFGQGYQLQPKRQLSIPTQYLCEERLTIRGPKGSIDHVGIIGPLRERSQVEITRSDGIRLGVTPPIRLSGDLDSSAPITLVGPQGELTLEEGLIIAKRHIHMTTTDAASLGFGHKDFAMVVVPGLRSLVFDHVVVRVDDQNTHTELHIDTDEANTADLNSGDQVTLLLLNDKKIRLERLIGMFDERQLKMLETFAADIVEREKQKLQEMESLLNDLR